MSACLEGLILMLVAQYGFQRDVAVNLVTDGVAILSYGTLLALIVGAIYQWIWACLRSTAMRVALIAGSAVTRIVCRLQDRFRRRASRASQTAETPDEDLTAAVNAHDFQVLVEKLRIMSDRYSKTVDFASWRLRSRDFDLFALLGAVLDEITWIAGEAASRLRDLELEPLESDKEIDPRRSIMLAALKRIDSIVERVALPEGFSTISSLRRWHARNSKRVDS
jgi:hypothetical protein